MAKRGKLQTTTEYLVARFVFGVLGRLPISTSMAIGRAIGSVAYAFARDLRRTAERNLLLAFPEKSSEERKRLVRGCFRSLGRLLGFFCHFGNSSPDSLRGMFYTRGLENLEEAEALNRGVILYTGHLGAWELTSFGLSLVGHPFTFLVRRLDNPKVEELVDRNRIRFGNQTLDKTAAARSMVKILRSNGPLGLLLDLNTLDEEAIFVNFFGVPAATTFIIAKLALRTRSPIVPVFAPWDEKTQKFLLEVQPLVMMEPSGDEDGDVLALTAKLTRIIEDAIRRHPDQWLWVHKRWKTRPPGEAKIY